MPPKKPNVAPFVLLLVLLFAFGLRAYRIDAQSLWADEGASVVMAERSVPQIVLHTAEDIHPPLYYVMLRGWCAFAGTSELAVRFPSLAFGLVFVAVLFPLGKRLFGLSPALMATIIAGASPALVYYSQEARMYMMVAALLTLSAYVSVRMATLRGEGVRLAKTTTLGLSYIAVSAAALYTQYFAVAYIAFQNLAFLALLPGMRRSAAMILLWLGLQAATALLYLPWYLRVAEQLGMWETSGHYLGLFELSNRALLLLGLGPTASAAPEGAGFVLLALLGVGLLWPLAPGAEPRGRRLRGYLAVVLYLTVPVLILFALSVSRPIGDLKILLPGAAPLVLLLALGTDCLWRCGHGIAARLGGEKAALMARSLFLTLALGSVGWAFAGPLNAYFFDMRYARDDYRGLVRHIAAAAGPDDAIVLNAPGQVEIFDYYYRGNLPRYPLPRERPPEADAIAREMDGLASRHGRAWLVLWGNQEADPKGLVEDWLNRNSYRTWSRWFGRVHLVLYTLPSLSAGILAADVRFEDGIRLAGYGLDDMAHPGNALRLALLWEGEGPTARRYKVFAHLVDDDGFLWGQHDAEPAGGSRPTTAWRKGETVTDRHGIVVAWGTPPGSYHVEVGLYDGETGARFPLVGDTSDRVLLGPVTVAKGSMLAPPLEGTVPLSLTYGPLRLRGYELRRVGSDALTTRFRRGDAAHLTLLWETEEALERDFNMRLSLVDKVGDYVFEETGSTVWRRYPTSRWEPGELVRDQHRLLLEVPPARYQLLVSVEGQTKSILELEVVP